MGSEKGGDSPGCAGCLIAWVCMAVLMLPVSFVLTEWLGLISVETERVVGLFIWFFGICVGGYYAARRGKSPWWRNSVTVGGLAELFVAAQLPKGTSVSEMLTSLVEMIKNPGPHWRQLVMLGLTIPVAILGGYLWESTRGVRSVGKESENRRKDEGPAA
jgi:peptidoglycan/LPS O-acetylase OafA/YrhL